MKLNRIIRNALKRQGIAPEKIDAALESLQVKPLRLKTTMIRRIEAMIADEGVAIVTRKQVHSQKGYAVRKGNAKHLEKARAFKAAKHAPRTPAQISAGLV